MRSTTSPCRSTARASTFATGCTSWIIAAASTRSSSGEPRRGVQHRRRQRGAKRRSHAHAAASGGPARSLIKKVQDRQGHDLRYSLDTAKLRALGWTPQVPFEEGLKDTVRWYRENEWWWRPIKEERSRVPRLLPDAVRLALMTRVLVTGARGFVGPLSRRASGDEPAPMSRRGDGNRSTCSIAKPCRERWRRYGQRSSTTARGRARGPVVRQHRRYARRERARHTSCARRTAQRRRQRTRADNGLVARLPPVRPRAEGR